MTQASNKTGSVPTPIYIGRCAPSAEADTSDAGSPARAAKSQRRSLFAPGAVEWAALGLEPRYPDVETFDCVAAIEPETGYPLNGEAFDRFLAGAVSRSEPALVLSVIGNAHNEKLGSSGSVRLLGGFANAVYGSRLPAGVRPALAPNLSPADHDLGLRLLNRGQCGPWWGLTLPPAKTLYSGAGPMMHAILGPDPGSLEPILVEPGGKPVVAAWISKSRDIRWYIVPDQVEWKMLLDWLVQRAVPQYVPNAARRSRRAGTVDPVWQTLDEIAAHEAVANMQARHAEEQTRIHGALAQAQAEAAAIRDALLYGEGSELVEIVDRILTAAGISTTNLDASEKGTWSADLLASVGDIRRLIEVKSARNNAGEDLVGDLRRHLDTWAAANPDQPVAGGALVVNHQRRLDPSLRTPQVYRRPEFVRSLQVQVISTLELFQWMKTSNWPAIRSAVFGTQVLPVAAHAETGDESSS
ncbi:hypothetical protein ACWEKT_38425 [Nocardia takedensis]